MEKRTIGKFIAVLRKANGMTQKELGERLFVSDKTVSRWEQDESTPELSLIPVIAEIFGITTDELLRGERSSPDSREEAPTYEEPSHIKAQKKKQFANMLHRHTVKFRNLSMISVGIALLGLIAAIICDVGFTRAVIGFCVGLIFLLASCICQICFTTSARLPIDEEESEDRAVACRAVNSGFVGTTLGILMLNLALFGFLLPLALFSMGGYTGIDFGEWMLRGLLFACIAVILGYLIYAFFIRGLLIRLELRYADEEEQERLKKNNKLLKRMLIIASAITLVFCVIMNVFNSFGTRTFAKKEVFDNFEDFKTFMEEGAVYASSYAPHVYSSDMSVTTHRADSEPATRPVYDITDFEIRYIYDTDGNVLCEYIYSADFCADIEYGDSGLPITVYTQVAMRDAYRLYSGIQTAILALIAVNILTCAAVYIKKSR